MKNILLDKEEYVSTSQKSLLEQALDYHRRGWSIIPVRAATKIPTVEWKQYQDQRPEEGQVRDWFSGSVRKNIAVVLGGVSGGLTCRDFDTMESYEAWARQYPELAVSLPTVETSRGKHVYFLSNHRGIRKLNNGELRGTGGYCLLPPPVHKDGTIYKWIIPLGDTIPTLNPEEVGLTEDTEDIEETDDIEDKEDMEAMYIVDDLNTTKEDWVKHSIHETIPNGPGQRNKHLFEFCRYLKAHPEIAKMDIKELKPYVQQWHEAALPYIATKPFDTTWEDFIHGWSSVKWPKYAKILAEALKATLEATDILPEAEGFDEATQRLTRLCYELQKLKGEEPIFVPCRKGESLGIDRNTIGKKLKRLVVEGVLELVQKHTGNRATRYRYIARQPVQMGMETTCES